MLLGLESYSYHLAFENGTMDVFSFIRRVQELGLDGLQLNTVGNPYLGPFGHLGNSKPGHLQAVRELIEECGLYLELDTRHSDISDLHRALDLCKALGATILRTYQIPENGRIDAAQAARVLTQAGPRCQAEGVRIAFENHEYQTAAEALEVVQLVNSDWVGVFCDTGNGMPVWEDPDVTVATLAPYAITTHFKDHVVIEENGQLIVATVALGQGSMNLEKHFQLLVHAGLDRINIEAVYAYRTQFHRLPHPDAGYQPGQPAFAVISGPFEASFIPPAKFEITTQVLDWEDRLVAQSVQYVKQLRRQCKGT